MIGTSLTSYSLSMRRGIDGCLVHEREFLLQGVEEYQTISILKFRTILIINLNAVLSANHKLDPTLPVRSWELLLDLIFED